MDRKSARLLIADEHQLMAEGCAKMLQPEFEVIGIVTDGRALVQAAFELRPDALIVDVSMPHLNGLDAAKQIRRRLPFTKLVFLTVNNDPDLAAEAFRRGASGYILKHSGAEEFLGAIRRVIRGESYLSPLIARETMTYLLNRSTVRDKVRITLRQREILQLLAEGRAMKDVACILDISKGTVAFHKYSMMEKLGVTTNAGLLLYAIKHNIIPAREPA